MLYRDYGMIQPARALRYFFHMSVFFIELNLRDYWMCFFLSLRSINVRFSKIPASSLLPDSN